MKNTEMAQFRVRTHQYGVKYLYRFIGSRWECIKAMPYVAS